MVRTIGLVTGGGDAPGLNAVIRAAVKTAAGEYGLRVIGIEDSFEGLLGEPRLRELTPNHVRGLLPRGGTILGTSNAATSPRARATTRPDARGCMAKADNLLRLGIDALIVVGGDGSLGIAAGFDREASPSSASPRPSTTIWPRR